jgi:beta-lactamase superfamily II metal-dependent hydrolase
MYNIGFGDAFLLEFARTSRPFRMLVDCGAHSQGYGPHTPAEVADRIIDDVTDTGGPALDVVVASHRHRDHVHGFASDRWREVAVGEVWMPWTEHPTDPEAAAIRERQVRLALAMDASLADQRTRRRYHGRPAELSGLQGLVEMALSNERAMRTLHNGFAGRAVRRFLSVDPKPVVPSGAPPGLQVHVLGPHRDIGAIRDMNPPSGQSYLRFLPGSFPTAGTPGSPPSDREHPFPPAFGIASTDFEKRVEDNSPGYAHLGLSRAVKGLLKQVCRDDDLFTAVALDQAVNGTSLMLVIEFGEAVLLFPGDAQWGTWQRALDDPVRLALLQRTTFYKVSHHGSHNGTPRSFLEDGPSEQLWGAATSVHPIERWEFIPKAELLAALNGRTQRVVRSDEPPAPPGLDGVIARGDISIDFELPC